MCCGVGSVLCEWDERMEDLSSRGLDSNLSSIEAILEAIMQNPSISSSSKQSLKLQGTERNYDRYCSFTEIFRIYMKYKRTFDIFVILKTSSKSFQQTALSLQCFRIINRWQLSTCNLSIEAWFVFSKKYLAYDIECITSRDVTFSRFYIADIHYRFDGKCMTSIKSYDTNNLVLPVGSCAEPDSNPTRLDAKQSFNVWTITTGKRRSDECIGYRFLDTLAFQKYILGIRIGS